MNIRDICREWLAVNGYIGLEDREWSDDPDPCRCGLDDLMRCSNDVPYMDAGLDPSFCKARRTDDA